MPRWPYVISNAFRCRTCNTLVTDCMQMCWGRSGFGLEYRVGEYIEWIGMDEGVIFPSFILRLNGDYNYGDPTLNDLWALDAMEAACSPPIAARLSCSACRAAIESMGVRIVNNQISNARVFMKGELDLVRSSPDEICEYIEIRGPRWINRVDLLDREMDSTAFDAMRQYLYEKYPRDANKP